MDKKPYKKRKIGRDNYRFTIIDQDLKVLKHTLVTPIKGHPYGDIEREAAVSFLIQNGYDVIMSDVSRAHLGTIGGNDINVFYINRQVECTDDCILSEYGKIPSQFTIHDDPPFQEKVDIHPPPYRSKLNCPFNLRLTNMLKFFYHYFGGESMKQCVQRMSCYGPAITWLSSNEYCDKEQWNKIISDTSTLMRCYSFDPSRTFSRSVPKQNLFYDVIDSPEDGDTMPLESYLDDIFGDDVWIQMERSLSNS